ncbi:MAG: FAD-dependent monooxygenase [Pseudonocardia sp.]|nr:FAD-dependent monooxygenase [Pseudonocardia sp.]
MLLIGDAAHVTSPNMAQGAAMALEDAIVLAESLTAAASIPAALTAYEHRRRPRIDWVLTRETDPPLQPPASPRAALRHGAWPRPST